MRACVRAACVCVCERERERESSGGKSNENSTQCDTQSTVFLAFFLLLSFLLDSAVLALGNRFCPLDPKGNFKIVRIVSFFPEEDRQITDFHPVVSGVQARSRGGR